MKLPKQKHVKDFLKVKHQAFTKDNIDWAITQQEEDIRNILQKDSVTIGRDDFVKVEVRMMIRGGHMAAEGVSKCLDGDIRQGWYLLRKSMVYRFFKSYVCYPIWKTTRHEKNRHSEMPYTIGLVSTEACLAALSLVISPQEGTWLLNHMEDGLSDRCFCWTDTDFFGAYLVRLHRMLKGEPDIQILPPDSRPNWEHPYDAIFANWNNEDGLAHAIYNMCEYHLHANHRDWEGHIAEFVYAFACVNPIELHVLEHVRSQLCLTTPRVDHELCQTPLYPVPDFIKNITIEEIIAEDVLLKEVVEFLNHWVKYPLLH